MEFDKNKDYSAEAEILKVLGHPVRLKILSCLCSEECNVKHLWECFGLPQATVSQHLVQLKNARIVSRKRVGNEVHYSVVHPAAIKIIELLTGN